MIYICDECGKEFSTTQALGGHVRQKHPRGASSGASSAARKCPVCGWVSYYRGEDNEQSLTCCSRCLALWDRATYEVVSPAPELCMAEKHGLPCPNEAHKKYYKERV